MSMQAASKAVLLPRTLSCHKHYEQYGSMWQGLQAGSAVAVQGIPSALMEA